MTAVATARNDERSTPGGAMQAAGRPVLRLLGREVAEELAGQVHSGRELERRQQERRRGTFPTGLPELDRLLDGGLPRGWLVELVGRPGCGRFATAVTTLAAATAAGEAAALVDLGDHLDPECLAAAGATLERLLWLRPRTTREALAAAEMVLDGGFPLLVVDLGLPPVAGGRGPESGWVRLARAAQARGAALLVSSPYRVSGTAAHTVIEGRPRRGAYAPSVAGGGLPSPPLLAGLAGELRVEKSRGRQGRGEATLELLLPGACPPPPRARRRAARRGPRRTGSPVPATPTAEPVPASA